MRQSNAERSLPDSEAIARFQQIVYAINCIQARFSAKFCAIYIDQTHGFLLND